MSGKNLVLELNAKLLSANQIAGFLSFNISKKYWRYKVDFVRAASYLLKLQIDRVSFGGCDQAYPPRPKEAFKTLVSQKLMEA